MEGVQYGLGLTSEEIQEYEIMRLLGERLDFVEIRFHRRWEILSHLSRPIELLDPIRHPIFHPTTNPSANKYYPNVLNQASIQVGRALTKRWMVKNPRTRNIAGV